MAGEWKETKLGNVLSFSNGKSSPERANDLPYPVYGSNGTIGFANETNAGPNTIVIGRVGSYCGSLLFSDRKCWVTDNAIRASALDENDARFLFYLLQTLHLNNWRGGSGQPLLNQTILASIPASTPESTEQRAIAHILGALDDKIELNRRMNETLEAIARAIFKSWFVDFDPVRAKSDGRQPMGIDADTAALFPDSFEDSLIGKIPKGWQVQQIGDVVRVVGGSTPSTKNRSYWGGSVRFATPRDMSGLESPLLLETSRKITEEGLARISSGLLPVGTVLLSSRAPVGYLAIAEVPVSVNQGIVAMVCEDEPSCFYVLNWAKENLPTIIGLANGTTFAEISKSTFRQIELFLPSKSLSDRFQKTVVPFYNKIRNNLFENETLKNLRDSLLPKLISGEIRIKDAEKFLGDIP
ncbi:MAG: restriction endonuclease subunit S [Actinobacteria bacterium]|nr:restriction endonuclease subunit S [Actinomycetota bacterium]MCG2819134.1 restriction endonuclease subunit S [Actinomycetes bacterium]MBU4218741.1 restriction endonuclease subunit S [Actinomycetota bacterium]MBU4359470.1 restriction endonuclease subunit S [Actinomycetota bacterium]MBU4391341.1 restriction endonuclease subunit S [Actinomycetota bacterium]